ncbi:MAG TPA: hypothetical protein V6D02_13310 [Candidatus Obscuribacterales bacterium]
MNRPSRRLQRHRYRQIRDRWPTAGAIAPSPADPDWQNFEADLTQLETGVQALRQRFEQVRHWQAEQRQVTQQLQQPGLSAQAISDLKQQLDELELQLESSLFDWRSLREPFWQAVRFGGLGLVLGWLLHSVVSR